MAFLTSFFPIQSVASSALFLTYFDNFFFSTDTYIYHSICLYVMELRELNNVRNFDFFPSVNVPYNRYNTVWKH